MMETKMMESEVFEVQCRREAGRWIGGKAGKLLDLVDANQLLVKMGLHFIFSNSVKIFSVVYKNQLTFPLQ